jgi:uncharacterized membrane protein
MDTAYQLSDTIMNVDKEPQNGTVIKRECDVITTDLLANDVEPNSYYQEWVNTFKKPEKTDLIRVAYVDSGNQVPDIVYLPAAIGISIGRICGLSGMMTYKLGRIFPLVFYIMLVWLAVSVLPFCNSMTGMTGLSLIALQQASSASYDAIINGVIILFVSLCVALAYGNVGKKNKLYIFLTLLSALLIVTVKGGVYIPVLMLLILPVERSAKAGNSLLKTKYIIGGSCAVIVACLLVFRRFYALLNTILSTGDVRGGDGYTLSYAFKHPALIVYIFVRTIFNKGEVCIRGMFGGMLGWHNISVSWIFIMPLCCGMFLLIHSENERPPAKKSFKAVCIAVTFITTILIMLAMLFSETKMGKPNIWGLQGRYLIPVEAVLLMALSTSMITVNHNQKQKIIFAMLTIQAVAMLEIVALII